MSEWGTILNTALDFWQGHPCRTGQRVGARRREIPWSSWLGVGLTTLSWKHRFNAETRRTNSLDEGNTMTVPQSRCMMMNRRQSQKDAPGLIGSLVHPKHTMRIGNWNLRTFYRAGNLDQAAREMGKRGIAIMGISEMHWTGHGKVQQDFYLFLFTRR